MVKALIDHEAVGEDQGLARVISLDEIVHHDVTALNVLRSEALFGAFTLDQ